MRGGKITSRPKNPPSLKVLIMTKHTSTLLNGVTDKNVLSGIEVTRTLSNTSRVPNEENNVNCQG